VSEPDQIVSAPEDRSPPVRWGLGDAAVGWLVGLVGGAVGFAVVLAVSGTGPDDADNLGLGWLAVAQLGLWIGLLGAPYLAARFKGNGMRRDFGLRAVWSDLPVGGLCGLIGQFAIFWVVYVPISWVTDVTAEEFTEPAQDMADRASDPLGVVLLILIVGLGAPIVEEVFYRGLLQRSLMRRVGPGWGIALASVLFGAAHIQPLQFPALALAGALFGVLAYRYGRLGPAIAAHMVFNLTAVISLLVTS
jgi:uncharacterized protein